MALLVLSPANIAYMKRAMRHLFPHVKPTHLTEALANAAWPRLSADRKKLNPTFLAIVKAGLKAERIDDDVSVARDNQILTDEEVGAILQAACEVDQEQGFDGVDIGSSYVWPRPARSMPWLGERAWATYRFLHGV